jgi:hypothetical protein
MFSNDRYSDVDVAFKPQLFCAAGVFPRNHTDNNNDQRLFPTPHPNRHRMRLIDFAELQKEAMGAHYRRVMSRAKFCLVPRGDQRWTRRLLDAFRFGCVPIVLSDGLSPMPYAHVIPWERIAIVLPESLFYFPPIYSNATAREKEMEMNNNTTLPDEGNSSYLDESEDSNYAARHVFARQFLDFLRGFHDVDLCAIRRRIHDVYKEYLERPEQRSATLLHCALMEALKLKEES